MAEIGPLTRITDMMLPLVLTRHRGTLDLMLDNFDMDQDCYRNLESLWLRPSYSRVEFQGRTMLARSQYFSEGTS